MFLWSWLIKGWVTNLIADEASEGERFIGFDGKEAPS